MSWSNFLQCFLFLLAGAQIYSCGKAGASLLAPITNAFQRATEALANRRENREKPRESVVPQLKS